MNIRVLAEVRYDCNADWAAREGERQKFDMAVGRVSIGSEGMPRRIVVFYYLRRWSRGLE